MLETLCVILCNSNDLPRQNEHFKDKTTAHVETGATVARENSGSTLLRLSDICKNRTRNRDPETRSAGHRSKD